MAWARCLLAAAAKPAVRVDLNPLALAHYQIGLAQVRLALQAANANSPKGLVEDRSNRWIISATDQLLTAEQIFAAGRCVQKWRLPSA